VARRRIRFGALALALSALSLTAVAAEPPGWTVERVAGATRYETAIAASARAFPDGADDAVVASGESFADALAATPVAARLEGPLLLTRRDVVPDGLAEELRRLDPERIILAGGTAAVSAGVEFALATIAPVQREAGADRFATSVELAYSAFSTGAPVAFLANGRNFPDALAAGNVAARLGGPVLLVERDRLPGIVRDAVNGLRPARLVLVGGPAAITEDVRRQLAPHDRIDRVGGADRYETAAALIGEAPGTSDVGVVASGRDFADALAGGAVAGATDGSLVLAAETCLPTSEAQRLVDHGVDELLVIGGTRAVADGATDPCGTVTTTTSTSATTTTALPTTTTSAPTTSTTSGGGSGGGGGGGGGSTAPTVPTLSLLSKAPGDFPDPTVLRVEDTWYAYSTQVLLVKVPVRSTDDPTAWDEDIEEAMPELPDWAEFGRNWAPSVVATEQGYVLWYTARHAESDRQCISRATSDSPLGPFVDELEEPAVCQLELGGSIDPFVFTDDDGSRFLYWKSDENALGDPSRIWVAPLTEDATRLTAPEVPVLAQSQDWEDPTMEQPAVVRDGSTYHLFYSGGHWESSGYAVGYATGASPVGPFTKRSTTRGWFRSRTGTQGPGALDVLPGPDGELWASLHAWDGVVGYQEGGSRTMRLGRLTLP